MYAQNTAQQQKPKHMKVHTLRTLACVRTLPQTNGTVLPDNVVSYKGCGGRCTQSTSLDNVRQRHDTAIQKPPEVKPCKTGYKESLVV